MLSKLASLELAVLEGLQKLTETAIGDARRDIEQQMDQEAESGRSEEQDELETYGEHLAGELHELEDIHRELILLSTVALYHRLESQLGRVFAWRFNSLPDPKRAALLWKVHKWKSLGILTQDYLDFSLEAVAAHSIIDKLRRIANSVKHSHGVVTREVHEATGWSLRKPINVAKIDMGEFRTAYLTFVLDFAEKAEAGLWRRFGNPGNEEIPDLEPDASGDRHQEDPEIPPQA